jgi:hypothetical protein
MTELTVSDTAPLDAETAALFGPWRPQLAAFDWQGPLLVLTSLELGAPEYRFQAVQDADRLVLLGQYDAARALYQDAIFSDKLKWWSPALKGYWEAAFFDRTFGTPSPPVPSPDPSEYSLLAAYARFRILQVFALNGWIQDGEVLLTGIQKTVPQGTPGAVFAEAARVFWEQYRASLDVSAACEPAISHIAQTPGVLNALGSADHGLQSHRYRPTDTCPF